MRTAFRAAVTLVLLSVPMGSRAAAATGPDALSAQVAGVVGSGGQLALQLKPVGDAAARSLHIGDTFEDGWVLRWLTPSAAVLAKDGVSRVVGLNPGGVVASTAAPVGGATVTVAPPTLSPQARAQSEARAALTRAIEAVNNATPENKPALEAAVNAARVALIDADNASLAAMNAAIQAQQPATRGQ